MIDINLLRENPDVFRASQRARGKDETHVDRILEADTARRALIGEYETLRAEQNAFGKTVAKAPKEEKPALVAQAKELAARVNEAKAASEAKTAEYEELISSIENLIIDGVPVGGEDDYVVVKEVGTPATSPSKASNRATTSKSANSSTASTWHAAQRSPAHASTSSRAR